MKITIPGKLKKKMDSEGSYNAQYSHVFAAIEDLMRANPEFFPDYTDHGIDHVQSVLNLAAELIPDETLDALRAKDVDMLICGIAIHDLGMFLSADGLMQLLEGPWKNEKNDRFHDPTWEAAWQDHLARTCRLSDEKMIEQFGEKIDVAELSIDPKEMRRRDYLVTGEFLRRNHPRLAYEIAVKAFPGTTPISILPFKGDERKLIGLLARSHGMALRKTEAYLETFSNPKKPCGCPIFYLMAVLRLADLLDAGIHRAPRLLLDRQAIYVPVSRQEWLWNQSIDLNDYNWEPSEDYLAIDGDVDDAIQYMLVKNWMQHLQQELDLSWSVIAEKYRLAYQLSIHRIRSSFLNPEDRKYQDDFLTKDVRLTVNPGIVKQLIAPLYGNEPTYGVRELVQNAVDACIEHEEKERQAGNTGYKGHVRVEVTEDTFTITDNGIGMNEDVLLNYYLSAGSSYRSSDAWKEDFAPDGTSQIARTGRFGVGFLAAFLLGDQIKVETRHRDDQKGYAFEFDQESRPLNVKRIERETPGTTITITLRGGVHTRLSKDAQAGLSHSWNKWYVFDDPVVSYQLDGSLISSPEIVIPRNPTDPYPWFRLESEKYKNYLWTYRYSANFFCNGIYIPQYKRSIGSDYGFSFDSPSVSVIDPDASLNMDLARKYVLEFPEEKLLVQELYRYVIAGLLVSEWNYSSGCRIFPFSHVPCLQCSRGFLPNHPAFRIAAKVSRYLALCSSTWIPFDCGYADPITPSFLTEDIPFMALSPDSSFHRLLVNGFEHGIPYLLDPLITKHSTETYLDYQSFGVNIWLSSEAYHCLHTPAYPYQPLDSLLKESDAHLEHSMLKWDLSTLPLDSPLWKSTVDKETGRFTYPTPELIRGLQEKCSGLQMPIDVSRFTPDEYAFAVHCLTADQIPDQPSRFTQLLIQYLGPDIWIPYNMDDRKAKFPDAFKELKTYIDHFHKHPYG